MNHSSHPASYHPNHHNLKITALDSLNTLDTVVSRQTQTLHHSQERVMLLRMVRVLAAHRTAKTRLLKKVQDLNCRILWLLYQ
jgi:hypothetical protein